MQTLRLRAAQAPAKSTWQRLWEMVGNGGTGILLLFAPTNDNTMCRNYGHVTAPTWVGMLPKCTDCGVVVKDTSMLRSARAR